TMQATTTTAATFAPRMFLFAPYKTRLTIVQSATKRPATAGQIAYKAVCGGQNANKKSEVPPDAHHGRGRAGGSRGVRAMGGRRADLRRARDRNFDDSRPPVRIPRWRGDRTRLALLVGAFAAPGSARERDPRGVPEAPRPPAERQRRLTRAAGC